MKTADEYPRKLSISFSDTNYTCVIRGLRLLGKRNKCWGRVGAECDSSEDQGRALQPVLPSCFGGFVVQSVLPAAAECFLSCRMPSSHRKAPGGGSRGGAEGVLFWEFVAEPTPISSGQIADGRTRAVDLVEVVQNEDSVGGGRYWRRRQFQVRSSVCSNVRPFLRSLRYVGSCFHVLFTALGVDSAPYAKPGSDMSPCPAPKRQGPDTETCQPGKQFVIGCSNGCDPTAFTCEKST